MHGAPMTDSDSIPVDAQKLIERQRDIMRRIALIEVRLGILKTRANRKTKDS